MSIASLKQAMSNVEGLKEKFNKSQGFQTTSEWFKPGASEAGTGYVVMRFLPPAEGDTEMIVDWTEFNWKGETGRNYWGKSRRNLGKEVADPCQSYLDSIWDPNDEKAQQAYRKRKRRKKYAANVYIVEDKENPENNGKVFPFKFGPAIYSKIEEAFAPEETEYETKESFNPFDPFGTGGGRNFVLRFKMKSEFRNYDDSDFEANASALFDDDVKLEEVWKQAKPISRFTKEDQYESYEVLHKRLVGALGYDPIAGEVQEDVKDTVASSTMAIKESSPESTVGVPDEPASKAPVDVPSELDSASIDIDDLDDIDIDFS